MAGAQVRIYVAEAGAIGLLEVQSIAPSEMIGRSQGNISEIVQTGTKLRTEFGVQVVSVILSALRPCQVWLTVVLVSLIGFVG